jgi:hypothetical protein
MSTPTPTPTSTFAGEDILSAVQAWWQATPAMTALTSDHLLWAYEAPETTLLPYATVILVSEPVETWTTSYAVYRSTIQVNLHANTTAAARTLAGQIRLGLANQPLVITGQSVMLILPDSSALQIGEGLGPNGQDCWVAIETFAALFTQ